MTRTRSTSSPAWRSSELLREAEYILLESGAVEVGDTIVLTIGEPIGTPGGTNTMKIVRVGEHSHSAGRSSL